MERADKLVMLGQPMTAWRSDPPSRNRSSKVYVIMGCKYTIEDEQELQATNFSQSREKQYLLTLWMQGGKDFILAESVGETRQEDKTKDGKRKTKQR